VSGTTGHVRQPLRMVGRQLYARQCSCGEPWPCATASLDGIKANLASLNEIIAEMTAAVSHEAEFTEMVRGVLRDHSWKLGFTFQGQEPPAQLGETP
jgi:hypothetical protein